MRSTRAAPVRATGSAAPPIMVAAPPDFRSPPALPHAVAMRPVHGDHPSQKPAPAHSDAGTTPPGRSRHRGSRKTRPRIPEDGNPTRPPHPPPAIGKWADAGTPVPGAKRI